MMATTNITNLLVEAGSLLFVGMSFVFVFLTILIFAVMGLQAFCQRFPGQEPALPSRSAVAKPKPQQSSSDGNHIAAISAAVHAHRTANR